MFLLEADKRLRSCSMQGWLLAIAMKYRYLVRAVSGGEF